MNLPSEFPYIYISFDVGTNKLGYTLKFRIQLFNLPASIKFMLGVFTTNLSALNIFFLSSLIKNNII